MNISSALGGYNVKESVLQQLINIKNIFDGPNCDTPSCPFSLLFKVFRMYKHTKLLLKKDIDYNWYCLGHFTDFLVSLHDFFDTTLKKKTKSPLQLQQ